MTTTINTPGGALRAIVLARLADGGHDIGQRMWRDRAPDGATFPYLTFVDPTSSTPLLTGDRKALARYRLSEWHLWQKRGEESDELLTLLEDALDGTQVGDLEGYVGPRTFTTRLRQTIRVPDPDRSVVHHALTVSVAHRSS